MDGHAARRVSRGMTHHLRNSEDLHASQLVLLRLSLSVTAVGGFVAVPVAVGLTMAARMPLPYFLIDRVEINSVDFLLDLLHGRTG